MEELIERKRKRFKFLHSLYKKSNGNLRFYITIWEIGEELGFSREETQITFQYL